VRIAEGNSGAYFYKNMNMVGHDAVCMQCGPQLLSGLVQRHDANVGWGSVHEKIDALPSHKDKMRCERPQVVNSLSRGDVLRRGMACLQV
jgi:hypothetical protein